MTQNLGQTLVTILSTGTTNYLNMTYFGWWTMPWNWHSFSKVRANRINAYLEVPAIRGDEQLLLILMLTVLKSGANDLKQKITDLFVDNAMFKTSYLNMVKSRSESAQSIDRYDICSSIVLENLTLNLGTPEARTNLDLLLKEFESNSEISTDSIMRFRPISLAS